VHGIVGIGGGTATLVATSIMRRLPFGFPKLMASPMAAHPAYIDKYVGTRDITMHHTVLDIVKMNPLLKAQIVNAIGAICGMVEMTLGTDFHFDKPCVAISSFGFGEMAVQSAIGMLEEAGFTPVVCHAQGKGDKAMEEMIRDGAFAGVLDLCIGGVAEHLFKGNRDPGPDRLLAAVEAGIPMLLAPCGLDILSYGGRADMLRRPRTGRSTCRTRCACRCAPPPTNCARWPTSSPSGSTGPRGRGPSWCRSKAGRRWTGRAGRSTTRWPMRPSSRG
jgi:uncharacterized protein (UPF0261 family)